MEQWTIINPLDEGIEHANGVTIEGPEGVIAMNVLEQDAACIAAAPDLLAALEHIEKVAAINAGPGLVDIRSTAYHAIRKAKGGE